MTTGHVIKRGDAATLRWSLGRDLSDVTAARVIITTDPGPPPVIDRNGVIDDAPAGIVSLGLTPADYGQDLLQPGEIYRVEIETQQPSGSPLTHPDDGWGTLRVVADLG